jgi:hypothetical protein
MPWMDAAHCPMCHQIVAPALARGELRTCLCGQVFVGLDQQGEVHVSGPDGTMRVPVFVPYREQLSLPL